MDKLSNTEAELKKSATYKKSVTYSSPSMTLTSFFCKTTISRVFIVISASIQQTAAFQLQLYYKKDPTRVFSLKFSGIPRNVFFIEHLQTAANISNQVYQSFSF